MKLLSRACVAICVLVSFSIYAEEVILPVIDGMILELGNHAQQVQVRAKSLGPGACAVTFSLGGKELSFLAPLLIWSPWTELNPAFLSKTSQKLDFRQGCDTGAIAEVKFSN